MTLPNHACAGQFWKLGAPPREEMVDEVDEDELDLQGSGSYLDSSTASAWSERSLDPGDIRVPATLPASFLMVSARCWAGSIAVLPPGLCASAGPFPCP